MNDARRALAETTFATYWLDSLPVAVDEPALCTDVDCDLLVVGGGFCGLWAAILAKQQRPERDVLLIEARSVANGASGRPAAILSTSVMHGIDNTKRMFPDEIATLEALGRQNMDDIAAFFDHYSIDCDIEWNGEMKVSIGDAGVDAIGREFELLKAYGHDVMLLDRDAVQAEINSPLFHAGVWSRRRSGILHPGKLVRELKRVALSLGVRIHEHTPLLNTQYKADRIKVKTPQAMITANRVLLATNAFAAGHRAIKRRVAAIRDRIVVTEPLRHEHLQEIGWSNRQGIYDTRTQLNYMRLTADNRILFGGRLGYFFGNNTDPEHDRSAEPYIRLVNAFHHTFPALQGAIRFSHAWSGPIGLTTRMAVHYQKFHENRMIFAGGYSGFGVTASRFGARIGLALLDHQDVPEAGLKFARTVPNYIPPEPFRWLGAVITMYALDTVDEKGGWRNPWIKMVQRMGFPITL